MKIIRQTATSYAVIHDEQQHSDFDMRLEGRELRSNEKRGDVRLRTMRIKLGAKSYDQIANMPIGDSLFF